MVTGVSVAVAGLLTVMLLINISTPAINDTDSGAEGGQEQGFIPDRQIIFGTVRPNQTISKSISIDSLGILRGEYRINFHGLANVTYSVANPDNGVLYGWGSIYPALVRIDEEHEYFVIRMDRSPPIPESLSGKLVFANYARVQDIDDLDLKDSIVLAERGGDALEGDIVHLSEKESNVYGKGAVALVVYNNAPGIFQGQLPSENTGYTAKIPVLSMSREDGLRLKELITNKDVVAVLTTDSTDLKSDISVSTSRFKHIALGSANYTLSIRNEGPSGIDATFDYTFTESK